VRNLKSKLYRQKNSVDKKILFLVLSFVAIGLIAVADASAPQALNNYGDKFFLFKQQLMWAGVGLIILFITSKIKYTFWEKFATTWAFRHRVQGAGFIWVLSTFNRQRLLSLRFVFISQNWLQGEKVRFRTLFRLLLLPH